jgi:hypothetical protein
MEAEAAAAVVAVKIPLLGEAQLEAHRVEMVPTWVALVALVEAAAHNLMAQCHLQLMVLLELLAVFLAVAVVVAVVVAQPLMFQVVLFMVMVALLALALVVKF